MLNMNSKDLKPESNPQIDRMYADNRAEVPRFIFDERVVNVFPDMINRSVPGYSAIIVMIGELAARYAQTGSRCYDLGCSLGGATFTMAKKIETPNVELIAVDSSTAMIEKLAVLIQEEQKANQIHTDTTITLIKDDILNIEISNASVVVLNFTLQFIPIELRSKLLAKIAKGMRPGGVLVLSEKIGFKDESYESLMTDMHHFFKAHNGYSQLEIAQKRSALEDVLVTETLEQHQLRLLENGFLNPTLWFQCFNFASLLAFK